jgi:hypothetical protein
MDMLSVLSAGPCVRCCNDSLGKIGGRADSEVLGHGNQQDAVLPQFTLVKPIADRIAEKAGLAMANRIKASL